MALLSFVPGVFLLGAGAIAGISVGALLVVAAMVVFFVFFFPKAKCKKNTKNCKDVFDEAHSLLTTSCFQKISRLGVLGKKSTEYAGFYEERKKTYDTILQKKDVPLSREIQKLTNALESKDYHYINEAYGNISRMTDEFQRSVNAFNADLTALLDDDTHVHSRAVGSKEKYRRISEFYQTHKAELVHTRDSFEIIISQTEAAFKNFDSLADSCEFSKAEETVCRQETILDSVLAIMDQLPLLEASLNHVIPDKQKEMNEQYRSLLSQDYVLFHLDVEGLNQRINTERDQLNEKMKVMDVSGVKEEADALLAAIMDMEASFVDEQNAKKAYVSSQSNILDSCFNTAKRYSSLMNKLPEFQHTYVMSTKYVKQMQALKKDIDIISTLKRELDSYLDTQKKQPYSIIIKKMTDIESEMKKTENMMNDYQAYTDSLRKDAGRVYEGLRNVYVELLKSEKLLRSIEVPDFVQKTVPNFESAYQQISEIYKVVLTTPIDVSKAVALYEPFHDKCEKLIQAVASAASAADDAESCIVYANNFNTYQEAQRDLISAQNEFSAGHFAEAAALAKKVVSTYDTTYVGK